MEVEADDKKFSEFNSIITKHQAKITSNLKNL